LQSHLNFFLEPCAGSSFFKRASKEKVCLPQADGRPTCPYFDRERQDLDRTIALLRVDADELRAGPQRQVDGVAAQLGKRRQRATGKRLNVAPVGRFGPQREKLDTEKIQPRGAILLDESLRHQGLPAKRIERNTARIRSALELSKYQRCLKDHG